MSLKSIELYRSSGYQQGPMIGPSIERWFRGFDKDLDIHTPYHCRRHSMPRENPKAEAPEDITYRIERAGWYSHLAKIGFALIILAFLLAVIGLLPPN